MEVTDEEMERIYEEMFDIIDAVEGIKKMEKEDTDKKVGWIKLPIMENEINN